MLSALGSALLLLATLVWIVDIVGRQTVGYSVIGLNDITQLFVMAFVSLALPITFLRERNVTVEFVVDTLPVRARTLLRALVALLTAAFVGALAYYSWRQALAQFSEAARSATLAIPMLYYWLPLLAGISLATLFCLVLAVRDCAMVVRLLVTGRHRAGSAS
jgi:TRAP-type C4-dicarboxylate transport system permease small subunit